MFRKIGLSLVAVLALIVIIIYLNLDIPAKNVIQPLEDHEIEHMDYDDYE
jgi:hypothetical protein